MGNAQRHAKREDVEGGNECRGIKSGNRSTYGDARQDFSLVELQKGDFDFARGMFDDNVRNDQ